MEVADNSYCFVCGQNNPLGFKAAIDVDSEQQSACCTVTIPAEFQGWKEMVHGGIISALLDEVCAHAGMTVNENIVTGELTTRFRRPVPVGREVAASARVIEQVRRTIKVEAKITLEGELMASAVAKMVVIRSQP
ncbi:MAG: PaaI family thioesterase [Desulfuromonas sp.]|nr:MAG: PaaI family thioesterase [Desulfuromonas sp.]